MNLSSSFFKTLGGSILIVFALVSGSVPAEDEWFPECRQVVLVSSDSWQTSKGSMSLWRKSDQGWKLVEGGIPVSLGRKGVGVGLGLHPVSEGDPVKREGDKRAPAGIFPLEFGFGRKAKPIGKGGLAYRRAKRSEFWVDDPKSIYYNQWVDMADGAIRKDWKSAEILARPDGLYDLVIVVGHNRPRPVAGRGSAIFLHRWISEGVPTIGCTAMDPRELGALWKWLDKDSAPLLVQGPASYLKKLKLPSEIYSSL